MHAKKQIFFQFRLYLAASDITAGAIPSSLMDQVHF
jgi:hypothetical protein